MATQAARCDEDVTSKEWGCHSNGATLVLAVPATPCCSISEHFLAISSQRTHELLHTKYTDLSRDTLPSVKEMAKDDEAR